MRTGLGVALLALAACGCTRSDPEAERAGRLKALLAGTPTQAAPPTSAGTPAASPPSAAPSGASDGRVWRATPDPDDSRPLRASPEDAARLAADDGPINPTANQDDSIRSLLEDFPWGDDLEGVWPGTDNPDPVPLQSVPDAEMLTRALADSGGRYVPDRHHALISVARRRVPGALEAIARAQQPSEDPRLREGAIAALIEHGRREALPLMWNSVADSSPFVRGNAVWAIALYGHEEALKAIQVALSDPHPYVVGMGILATTALRDEAEFWPILERTVVSPKQQIYQEAAYVLSQVDAPRARTLLRREYDRAKGERRAIFRWYLRQNLHRRLD